jgi:hypothetical protein
MGGLFNSAVLDVAIGLVFVYLLLGIICTSLNEWIAGLIGLRSRTLAKGIRQLLDGQASYKGPANQGRGENAKLFLEEFYEHPLISGMASGPNNKPSYIPARTFAAAVMDIATPPNPEGKTLELANLQDGLRGLPDGKVKKALIALLQNSQNDLAAAQSSIEAWYDDTMDRVSGWYKRQIQVITIVIATLLTIGINADSVKIAATLWHNPELRAEAIKLAQNRTEQAEQRTAEVSYPHRDDPLHPEIGPSSQQERQFLTDVLWKNGRTLNGLALLGWAMTIIAVSLGAPFWFDILNKIINIRSAGTSPDERAKAPQKRKRPPEDKAA